MHIVIMGCGRVGAELTVQLSKNGHSVAIIDKREEAFDRLPPGFHAKTVVGLGFDRTILEQAQIEDAGAFVAVSNGDNSNIVSARVAREHYHVERVVARIYDPKRAEIYERLDIPTIATVRWAAKQILMILFHAREELKEPCGRPVHILILVCKDMGILALPLHAYVRVLLQQLHSARDQVAKIQETAGLQ